MAAAVYIVTMVLTGDTVCNRGYDAVSPMR